MGDNIIKLFIIISVNDKAANEDLLQEDSEIAIKQLDYTLKSTSLAFLSQVNR